MHDKSDGENWTYRNDAGIENQTSNSFTGDQKQSKAPRLGIRLNLMPLTQLTLKEFLKIEPLTLNLDNSGKRCPNELKF